MTELLEKVTVGLQLDTSWECPFDHEETQHTKSNIITPPADINNASTLSTNLKNYSAKKKTIPLHVPDVGITFMHGAVTVKKYDARYTAHHVLPGNDCWNKGTNRLRKWIDKKKTKGTKIRGDIGYDVNYALNGIDLPGNKDVSGWSGKAPGFQEAYAFAAIEAHSPERQFHDAHKAYSAFVVKALNRVADRIEARLRVQKDLSCGKKGCPGAKPVSGKYDPPYFLLERLQLIANRLRGYLVGDAADWRKPIMTSRFDLMYQEKCAGRRMTQKQAREELDPGKF